MSFFDGLKKQLAKQITEKNYNGALLTFDKSFRQKNQTPKTIYQSFKFLKKEDFDTFFYAYALFIFSLSFEDQLEHLISLTEHKNDNTFPHDDFNRVFKKAFDDCYQLKTSLECPEKDFSPKDERNYYLDTIQLILEWEAEDLGQTPEIDELGDAEVVFLKRRNLKLHNLFKLTTTFLPVLDFRIRQNGLDNWLAKNAKVDRSIGQILPSANSKKLSLLFFSLSEEALLSPRKEKEELSEYQKEINQGQPHLIDVLKNNQASNEKKLIFHVKKDYLAFLEDEDQSFLDRLYFCCRQEQNKIFAKAFFTSFVHFFAERAIVFIGQNNKVQLSALQDRFILFVEKICSENAALQREYFSLILKDHFDLLSDSKIVLGEHEFFNTNMVEKLIECNLTNLSTKTNLFINMGLRLRNRNYYTLSEHKQLLEKGIKSGYLSNEEEQKILNKFSLNDVRFAIFTLFQHYPDKFLLEVYATTYILSILQTNSKELEIRHLDNPSQRAAIEDSCLKTFPENFKNTLSQKDLDERHNSVKKSFMWLFRLIGKSTHAESLLNEAIECIKFLVVDELFIGKLTREVILEHKEGKVKTLYNLFLFYKSMVAIISAGIHSTGVEKFQDIGSIHSEFVPKEVLPERHALILKYIEKEYRDFSNFKKKSETKAKSENKTGENSSSKTDDSQSGEFDFEFEEDIF